MKRTIYIYDCDDNFRKSLTDRIYSNYSAELSVIGDSGVAADAIRDVNVLSPDIFAVNVDFWGESYADVIRIIRRSMRIGTRIVTMCADTYSYRRKEALSAGADNCIFKPCGIDDAISGLLEGVDNYRTLSAFPENSLTVNTGYDEENDDMNTKIRIALLLSSCRMPTNIAGYSYICSAIMLSLKDPQLLCNMTKRLYPSVAAIHKTKSTCVERSIRHAIEKTWCKACDEGYLAGTQKGDAFRFAFYESEKPTNSEFISRAVQLIKMSMP